MWLLQCGFFRLCSASRGILAPLSVQYSNVCGKMMNLPLNIVFVSRIWRRVANCLLTNRNLSSTTSAQRCRCDPGENCGSFSGGKVELAGLRAPYTSVYEDQSDVDHVTL